MLLDYVKFIFQHTHKKLKCFSKNSLIEQSCVWSNIVELSPAKWNCRTRLYACLSFLSFASVSLVDYRSGNIDLQSTCHDPLFDCTSFLFHVCGLWIKFDSIGEFEILSQGMIKNLSPEATLLFYMLLSLGKSTGL